MSNDLKFYTRAACLDVLSLQKNPSQEVVTIMAEALKSPEYSQYFFRDLTNDAWLLPLKEEGVFKQVPEPIPLTETNYEIPFWEAIHYLIRMAPRHPDIVTEILLELPPVNSRVLWRAVEAMLGLPASCVAKIVPHLDKWLDCEFFTITNFAIEVGKLINLLVDGGEIEAALELLDYLTRPMTADNQRRAKVFPRIDQFHFGDLVLQQTKPLNDISPLKACKVLEKNLMDGLTKEHGDRADLFSYVWRSSIGDNGENEDYLDVMISGLRDAVLKAGEIYRDEPTPVVDYVTHLLSHSTSVLVRIGLFAVLKEPLLFKNVINDVVSDSSFILSSETRAEYLLLIFTIYESLTPEQRAKWWDAVTSKTAKEFEDEVVSGDVNGHNHTLYVHLWVIREHLTDEQNKLYTEFSKSYNEPTNLFNPFTVTTWSGEASPITESELLEMEPTRAIEYLQSFEQTERAIRPDVPTIGGLANTFRRVVVLRCVDYAAHANELLVEGLDTDFLSRFLEALTDSWKEGKTFDWKPVLAFCKRILAKEIQTLLTEDGFVDPYLKKTIGRLLQEGLLRSKHEIPIEFKNDVLDIIIAIQNDLDQAEMGQQEFEGTSGYDSFTLSMNRPHAQSIHALHKAAFWVARHEFSSEDSSRLDPVIRGLFEQNLNREEIPSLAVHSVFGAIFNDLITLDKDWAVSHLRSIFPLDEGLLNYWKTAMATYLKYGNFSPEAFPLLRDDYRKAIELVAFDELAGGDELAERMMLAYFRDLESLDDESLVSLFFSRCQDHYRADAMMGLWRAPDRDQLFKDAKYWNQIKTLWESRVEYKEVHPEQVVGSEFSGILRWCKNLPEDIGELKSLLEKTIEYATPEWHITEIVEYLGQQVSKYPSETILLLQRLQLSNGVQHSAFIHEREKVREILKKVLESQKQEDKDLAYDVISRFGERNDHSYQDLI